MGKTLAGFLVILALYGALLAWLYVNQRRLQYFPSFENRDGRNFADFVAWRDANQNFLGYIRTPKEPSQVVLFFHGNGGEAHHRAWLSSIIPAASVLILAEYPGYGAKPGEPTESSLFQAADIAVREATTQFGLPVVLVGESLGSGVAAYAASRHAVHKLALMAPFTSAVDVGARAYPFIPVRWMMKDRFDSLSHLAQVTVPLHIIHGSADTFVFAKLGRRLFESYPGKAKQFTELPGYEHNNLAEGILNSPLAEPFRKFFQP